MITRLFVGLTMALIATSARAADCEESDIQGKVCKLNPAYNKESRVGAEYEPPTCVHFDSNDERVRVRTHIRNAFRVAPEKIKNELCRLTKIFMADRFFGLWENPLTGMGN